MKNSINITKRLLPLLLAVLLLASCGGGNGAETSAVPESTAEPAYELMPDGGWTLTRAEKADDSVRDAAKAVRDAISARTGEAPQLGDDWLAPGTSAPEHEIIIGNTARGKRHGLGRSAPRRVHRACHWRQDSLPRYKR